MEPITEYIRLKEFSADEDWDFYLNTENEGVPAHPDFVLEKKKHFTSGAGNGLFEPLEFMNLLHRQFLFFDGNVAKPHATIAALNAIPLSDGQKRELFGSIIGFYGWKAHNPDNHFQHGIALGLLNRELSRLSSPYPAIEPMAYQYDMKDVAGCAAENDLDYYFNRTNIANHEFVLDAIAYFETGERKGYIEPLAFLNLLWKQYQFVNDNTGRPHTVVTTMQSLPINGELRHVLLAFILKWFRCTGYKPASNLNPQYDTTLKLIEEEFLEYRAETPDGDTPEKRKYLAGKEKHVPSLEFYSADPAVAKHLAERLHNQVMANVRMWEQMFLEGYGAATESDDSSEAGAYRAGEIVKFTQFLKSQREKLLDGKHFMPPNEPFFWMPGDAARLARHAMFEYYTHDNRIGFCEMLYCATRRQLWQPATETDDRQAHCNHVAYAIEVCPYFRYATIAIAYQKHLSFLQEFDPKQVQKNSIPEKAQTPAIDSPNSTGGLSLKQTALLYIYTGQTITRQDANDIARKYGHNSGDKLIQHYNTLSQTPNRLNVDGKKVQPLVSDIEKILPLLDNKQRQRADSELSMVKKKIS